MSPRFLVSAKACLVLALVPGIPLAGWAACTTTNNLSKWDADNAQIRFGRVNMDNEVLQPVGSLLAATAVPPQNYAKAQPNDVLWECDAASVQGGNVFFLVATNGDDRYGGFYDMSPSNPAVPPGTYAIWFRYVGLKLSIDGQTLVRAWQRFNLPPIEPEGNKVYIRQRHLPTLVAELYRLQNDPPNTPSSPHNYCASQTARAANAGGRNYACQQPSAYIQLAGPGVDPLLHDEPGQDSGNGLYWKFWTGDNGLGYSMYNAASLSNRPSCVVRNTTPVVNFPPVSVPQLMNGETVDQNFLVEIECQNNVSSGTNNNQTAIGIQVSPAAYQHAVETLAASTPPLRNAQGGITHLVADNYDQPGAAKGVGVTLWEAGARRIFLAQPGKTGSDPTWTGPANPIGNNAGWYNATAGATETQTGGSTRTWQHTYTARFGRVNDLQVTPGSFTATATVLVKVQ